MSISHALIVPDHSDMDIQQIRIAALRRLIDREGTTAAFARKCGIDPSYLSQLLNGHRGFGEKAARKIEVGAGLTPGYLDAKDQSNVAEPPASYANARKAPVISWVQAGNWDECHDPYPPGTAEDWEEVPAGAGDGCFWLRVVGDSMVNPNGHPSIPEGALILVDPSRAAGNGSLVIAKLIDSDQVTFKKLVEDAGQRYLKPLNPVYPMLQINGNCRIVGPVTEVRIKL